MRRSAAIYGLVTFGAIFFVGYITGLGGSLIPNLGFSLLMGLFAALCYVGAHKLGNRDK